jgi:hypothetical protein
LFNKNISEVKFTMGYNATYETTDVAPSAIDFVVGIFVGMASFGVLIGIGVALGLVGKHLPWVKFK